MFTLIFLLLSFATGGAMMLGLLNRELSPWVGLAVVALGFAMVLTAIGAGQSYC